MKFTVQYYSKKLLSWKTVSSKARSLLVTLTAEMLYTKITQWYTQLYYLLTCILNNTQKAILLQPFTFVSSHLI